MTQGTTARRKRVTSVDDTRPQPDDFPTITKPPQQGRSRASLERMLDAAEALMVQGGGDDFALTEVSRVGQVSIGSIYNRFKSKDELIHAVHARAMDRMEQDHSKIPIRARGRGRSGIGLIRSLIDDLGEHLRTYAPIMRPMMMLAPADDIVRERGRAAYEDMVSVVCKEMLTQREHIRHGDPEVAVRFVVKIAYSAFARELGFGMTRMTGDEIEWDSFRHEIGVMASAYLFSEPAEE